MNSFSTPLLKWHESIDRKMPWKETTDPYNIWISEVILQQTRVNQGRDYYLRFIDRFPNVESLALAAQEDVLKMWEGLGYYSRARNLHHAAQQIMEIHNGTFPSVYEEILALKGIGPYTAAAISSFAFNNEYAVVDGNVIRVLSRYFGIYTPFDTTPGKKEFQTLAQQLIEDQDPAKYNQAIMDFGALICAPKLAKCNSCPLNETCVSVSEDRVYHLPIKSKKHVVTDRYLDYVLFRFGEKVLIRRRSQKGIWAGLYEFPGVESDSQKSLTEVKTYFNLSDESKLNHICKISHKLTHLELSINVYSVDFLPDKSVMRKYQLQKVEELHKFAFPKPLKSLIDSKTIF